MRGSSTFMGPWLNRLADDRCATSTSLKMAEQWGSAALSEIHISRCKLKLLRSTLDTKQPIGGALQNPQDAYKACSACQHILFDRLNAGDLLRECASYRAARILNPSDRSVSIAIPGVLTTSLLRLEFASQPDDDKYRADLSPPRYTVEIYDHVHPCDIYLRVMHDRTVNKATFPLRCSLPDKAVKI